MVICTIRAVTVRRETALADWPPESRSEGQGRISWNSESREKSQKKPEKWRFYRLRTLPGLKIIGAKNGIRTHDLLSHSREPGSCNTVVCQGVAELLKAYCSNHCSNRKIPVSTPPHVPTNDMQTVVEIIQAWGSLPAEIKAAMKALITPYIAANKAHEERNGESGGSIAAAK